MIDDREILERVLLRNAGAYLCQKCGHITPRFSLRLSRLSFSLLTLIECFWNKRSATYCLNCFSERVTRILPERAMRFELCPKCKGLKLVRAQQCVGCARRLF